MKLLNSARSLLHPNVLLLSAALLAGTAGATLARNYLERRAQATDQQLSLRFAPRSVVVAGRQIQAGEQIGQEALAIRSIPQDFIPGDAVSAEQASSVLGRRSVLQLQRGDPLVKTNLRAPAGSLASLVTPGQRALTLSVDDVNTHAGLLKAGDRVDIYYSMNANAGAATLSLLLERVAVLATGSILVRPSGSRTSSDHNPEGFESITLLVSADDAARLVLAEHTGSLTVVLRATDDESPTTLRTRTSKDLWHTVQKSGAPTQPNEQVELLLGGSGGISPRRAFLVVGSVASTTMRSAP
jgi:pilus assembly protein CpaB